MIRNLLILFLFTFALSGSAQNTVGLIEYTEQSHEGYTLLSPINTGTTYLIDNCGKVINSWQSNFKPGLASYLREDGLLFRTARIQTIFNAGGSGGRLEVFDWEGEIVWAHNFASITEQTHHDISLLPNGNILMLLWDKHSFTDAVEKGKQADLIDQDAGLWSEKVWEIKILPDNELEIVWEWNSWDHLIQDQNQFYEGYGIVEEHPEKFNINYPPLSQSPDWLHMNSIDYNESLDQIVLSSRNTNEFYIIDHSTTTEEAKTSQGGIYGKGGDILYRWGNPAAYNSGEDSDKKLFGQHDVHWIKDGLSGAGNILLFNNGFGKPGVILASSIEEININPNGDGIYELNPENTYGPAEPEWTYSENLNQGFYAGRISGTQRLKNGNTLTCLGRSGRLVETTELEQLAWLYQSPVSINGPVPQGVMPTGTELFKVQRYDYDYPAFDGKITTPLDPIELDPNPTNCMTTYIDDIETQIDLNIYPQPFVNELFIEIDDDREFFVEIYNQVGQKVYFGSIKRNLLIKDELKNKGFYFINIIDPSSNSKTSSSIIKL